MRQISIATLRQYAGHGSNLFLAGAIAFFALIIGLALIATVNPLFIWRAPQAARETPAATPPAGEGRMRYGTIQLAPSGGNRCQQIEFDNATGGFVDKGEVACGQSLSRPTPDNADPPPMDHAVRVDIIRRGFLNR